MLVAEDTPFTVKPHWDTTQQAQYDILPGHIILATVPSRFNS